MFIALLFALICSPLVSAQIITYDRFDVINNYTNECYEDRISFFPSIICTEKIEEHVNFLPVYSNVVYNSSYSKGLNDGPTWQGRGANITISAGVSGKLGNFKYVFSPILQYAENRSFLITSPREQRTDFQYPFSEKIDYVTRFGNDPFVKLFPGQSEVSFKTKPVTFSISSQNIRWGPALYNPILMSNNASGIPQFRISNTDLWNTTIGKFEGNIFWGYLRESEYFNNNPSDDTRYVSGLSIGYQPSFFEGFSVGIHRVLYTQTDFLTNFFYDGFIAFTKFFSDGSAVEFEGRTINDVYDQLASITFHWENENKDFQLYAEWARGDFASSLVDFITQPEHNRAYTFGLWKEFSINETKRLRFTYENTSLAVWQTSRVRSSGSLYVHTLNRQGYTNNGQIIGASVGPGSSANVLSLSYFSKNIVFTTEYQRTRYNDDYFYTNFNSRESITPQDIEHQIGISFERKRPKLAFRLSSYAGIRVDYYFIPEKLMHNLHTDFSVRYYF